MNFLYRKTFLEQGHIREAHYRVFLNSKAAGNKDTEIGSAHPKIAFWSLIENERHWFTQC